VIKRGEIWWAELDDPRGSEPGFRRPVVVVQADSFNKSHIGTVVVAVLTSNRDLIRAPGNVALSRRDSKLSRYSVVNVSQLLTLDRRFLTKKISRLPALVLVVIYSGLRLVLSL
jgi:mRNA interferase MazF